MSFDDVMYNKGSNELNLLLGAPSSGAVGIASPRMTSSIFVWSGLPLFGLIGVNAEGGDTTGMGILAGYLTGRLARGRVGDWRYATDEVDSIATPKETQHF